MFSSLDELKTLIQTIPVIDNHGHNILRPQQLQAGNLLTVSTEASGEALDDTPSSLSHLRAARQLRQLYNLTETATWDEICAKRQELLKQENVDAFFKECFEGTQTILIDDGLDSGANIQPFSWHDTYTKSPCKRIVRIEAVAADILSTLHQEAILPVGVAIADEEVCSLAWVTFISRFEQSIVTALADTEVCGFKSVICYRTGLEIIPRRDAKITDDGLRSFRRHFLPNAVNNNFRIEAKGMNDALVISTCKLIAAHHDQKHQAKPFQFHTGLGDNDINLLDSNPACLQPLIKEFPSVPIVLLHSSYPYTREAGYLATCYKNAYLDIGEVFPMVSRDGQESIIRQALELTPSSKILWSTDGHHFPETYWLANKQGRQAIETVICSYVERGDMTLSEAAQSVQDIFFANSNKLYDLRLAMPNVDPAISRDDHAVHPYKSIESQALSTFLEQHADIKYVNVMWLDILGTIRCRILPLKTLTDMCASGKWIGISKGNLGTTQNDHMSCVANPVGQIMVRPDLRSLRRMHSAQLEIKRMPLATVMASLTHEDGSPLHLCPRSELSRLTMLLNEEFNMDVLVGFEIEVTFLRRKSQNPTSSDDPFEPMDTNHAWGTLTDTQYASSLPLLLEISEALHDIGIEIQQLHSESGPGQYEFVLPPSSPELAVDTLIQARQCIQQVAALHGLRATYHPMPFPAIGNGAHAHLSLNPSTKSSEGARPSKEQLDGINESFFASVLEHLPSICAFTMPQSVSYNRVVDDSWTMGTWVAFGTQNREVPLRKIDDKVTRWEIRCLDGLANMYLAIAAIFAAGIQGLRDGSKIMKDLKVNPSKLSDEERINLGITRKMPTTTNEALDALEQDTVFEAQFSDGFVAHYLGLKESEQEMLHGMEEQQRRIWLIERY